MGGFEFSAECLQAISAPAGENQRVPGGGKAAGTGFPDTRGGSGDEYDIFYGRKLGYTGCNRVITFAPQGI